MDECETAAQLVQNPISKFLMDDINMLIHYCLYSNPRYSGATAVYWELSSTFHLFPPGKLFASQISQAVFFHTHLNVTAYVNNTFLVFVYRV